MPTNLYDHLLNAYAVPRPNRPSGPGRSQSLKIDDQTSSDTYRGFCQIHAVFPDPEAATLTLELRNAPHGPEVRELVEKAGGQLKPGCPAATIAITIGPRDAPLVRRLAKAIRRVTGRGRRYPDPNWKWLVRRTAASLEGLANRLASYRRDDVGEHRRRDLRFVAQSGPHRRPPDPAERQPVTGRAELQPVARNHTEEWSNR